MDWNMPERASIPARELPMICFEKMGIRLASNVEELAYELNVDNDTLITLQTRSNPAKEVLLHWANFPDTTVYVLYVILDKLKRHDVIRIVEEYLTGEIDVTLLVKTKSSSKVYKLPAQPMMTIKELIPKIPELANVALNDIKFSMDCASEYLLDMPAKDYKGRQISLTTLDQPRITSEPVTGKETDQPKRHTEPKYPLQESNGQPEIDDLVFTCSPQRIPSWNGDPSCEGKDDSSTTFQIHVWPALSEYEIGKLFAPRLHQAGTYILRHSRGNDKLLSLSVIADDKHVVNYRIHGSDKKACDVYLFEGKEVFHSVKELLDYYTNHQMVAADGKKGPMLKKAI